MVNPTAEPIVDVHQLTVRFGDFTAVNSVSFQVFPGEIFGFLGANGAGKTTTIRVLCGLLSPTSGEIKIKGQSLMTGGLKLKEKVGYMSQKFTLYDDMTIAENLEFTSEIRNLPRQYFLKRQQELLDFIGFSRDLNVLVKDLPGGLKQQISLISAILHDPDLIFLDEPTAGVTPAARSRFWQLIRQLSDFGKTVFVTTHYMDEAEQCGRIALMRTGELVALDNPSALKERTFPNGLIELEPKQGLSYEQISDLKQSSIFSLFEPYGLRYHAEIRDQRSWNEQQNQLINLFEIQKIQPSLEDVFIRIVEGSK